MPKRALFKVSYSVDQLYVYYSIPSFPPTYVVTCAPIVDWWLRRGFWVRKTFLWISQRGQARNYNLRMEAIWISHSTAWINCCCLWLTSSAIDIHPDPYSVPQIVWAKLRYSLFPAHCNPMPSVVFCCMFIIPLAYHPPLYPSQLRTQRVHCTLRTTERYPIHQPKQASRKWKHLHDQHKLYYQHHNSIPGEEEALFWLQVRNTISKETTHDEEGWINRTARDN